MTSASRTLPHGTTTRAQLWATRWEWRNAPRPATPTKPGNTSRTSLWSLRRPPLPPRRCASKVTESKRPITNDTISLQKCENPLTNYQQWGINDSGEYEPVSSSGGAAVSERLHQRGVKLGWSYPQPRHLLRRVLRRADLAAHPCRRLRGRRDGHPAVRQLSRVRQLHGRYQPERFVQLSHRLHVQTVPRWRGVDPAVGHQPVRPHLEPALEPSSTSLTPETAIRTSCSKPTTSRRTTPTPFIAFTARTTSQTEPPTQAARTRRG